MNRLCTSSMIIAIGAVLSVSQPLFAQNLPPVVTQKIQAAQKQVKTIGMDEYRKVVERPGETLIVEDTKGEGHCTKSLDGAGRWSIFILLPRAGPLAWLLAKPTTRELVVLAAVLTFALIRVWRGRRSATAHSREETKRNE